MEAPPVAKMEQESEIAKEATKVPTSSKVASPRKEQQADPAALASKGETSSQAVPAAPAGTKVVQPERRRSSQGKQGKPAKLILKAHNDYRSQVANGQLQGYPPASDMFELVWDDEMAGVAQAWADQCIKLGETLDHDKVKDRFTTKFKTTGQNLAWDAFNEPLTPKWAARIKSWFDEYPEYDPLYIDRFEERGKLKKFGHFTQVVWAKSRAIGCGYAHYSVPGAERRYEQVYVCNYGPAGNLLGRAIYLQGGQPCGNCSNGTVCDNTTGLCAPPKAPSPAATTESTTTTENSHDHREDR
ncbi:hypothetical protein HPB48_010040 [Haemaphysalis longicornis]|uniref:SCP domain-containing protein n=1 Tax=Haemaphysalis longicornis TaxID=44386 RepID=A0A9J6GG66_HAELO|nr:hypothetical protein HPB48_010040 [Haemaphysalis longicornis]